MKLHLVIVCIKCFAIAKTFVLLFLFPGLPPDLKLSSILSDKALYSWKGDDKDITRKVILIGSNFVQNLDSVTKEALMVRHLSPISFICFSG